MPLPDISIHKFSRIASGSYNAGFVDFRTDDNGNVIPVPDYEQEPDDTMCPRCEVLLKSTAFGDTSKLDAPVFEPNGKYSTQVFNRLGNAESPIVKAEKLVETLVRHADTEHEQFYHDHAQITQEALEKLGTYLQNAGDSADQKASAFCAFVNSFTDAESSPLQNVFFLLHTSRIRQSLGDDGITICNKAHEIVNKELRVNVNVVINAIKADAPQIGGDKNFAIDIGI